MFTARVYQLNFDIVLRKLIPKLQAFSKGIQEPTMVRFYSTIHADNKMLIRQMSGDSVFHGVPRHIAAAPGSVPDQVERSLIRVGNSLVLAQRRDI